MATNRKKKYLHNYLTQLRSTYHFQEIKKHKFQNLFIFSFPTFSLQPNGGSKEPIWNPEKQ